MDYKVIENLIDKEEFKKIQNIFTNSAYLPWYYNSTTTHQTDDNDFMFTHTIYLDDQIKSDVYNDCINLFFKV